MKSKKDVHHSMKYLFNNVGVPPDIVDNFQESGSNGRPEEYVNRLVSRYNSLRRERCVPTVQIDMWISSRSPS